MRASIAAGIILAFACALAPARAEAEDSPSWPTYQGNKEHNGYVPVTLDPAGLTELWSETISTNTLHPVAAGDGMVFATIHVYFNDVDQLFALDARTGEVLWTKALGPVRSVNPPAYANGTVYLETGKGTSGPPPLFRAFDGATGGFLFQQQLEAQWEEYYAPTPFDGAVYVNGGYYGGMYSLDAFAPSINWFTPLNQYDEWTPALSDSFAYAYTGEYSPRLSIVDRFTGVEVRSIPDPNFDWNGWSMRLAPVLGANHDVVAVQGGRLLSFDIGTDSIRFELGPNYFSGQPSVAHKRIFVASSGALAVYDELDGTYQWGWSTTESVTGTILVTDNLVFVRTTSAVHAIDLASREEVWSHPVPGELAWSEGVLYIAGGAGHLVAIDAPALFTEELFRDGFESGDTSAWSFTVP